MSLIDRVQHLTDCTVPQARAAIAEIYRYVGEGLLVATDADQGARVLLDAARTMVQLNAADALPHAKRPDLDEPVEAVAMIRAVIEGDKL